MDISLYNCLISVFSVPLCFQDNYDGKIELIKTLICSGLDFS